MADDLFASTLRRAVRQAHMLIAIETPEWVRLRQPP
jgi:hypothetical protein